MTNFCPGSTEWMPSPERIPGKVHSAKLGQQPNSARSTLPKDEKKNLHVLGIQFGWQDSTFTAFTSGGKHVFDHEFARARPVADIFDFDFVDARRILRRRRGSSRRSGVTVTARLGAAAPRRADAETEEGTAHQTGADKGAL